MTQPDKPAMKSIRAKVASGQRLSAEEGLWLFSPEVHLNEVGELADVARQRISGNAAYYNINSHLNPTNLCVYRCGFCAFRADPRDKRAYVMSDQQILDRGREAVEVGATELHIVGGLHPSKKYDWYLNILRILHDAYPRLHLKAWTPVEIDWFCRLTGRPARAILQEMIQAGLGSLPGGGAEIFHPEVRSRLCQHKADAETWLAIHRTAHELGLRSNATMLYGHVESAAHRIDHLLRLRALQDETDGFQTFIPLAFHPENTALAHVRKASAPLSLRTLAVSRLVLDNFDHVKAYWIMLGVGTAQIALAYGADDLDGTVRHELICHDAGGKTPEVLSVEEIRRLIVEAGRDPVERDTLYRRIRRDGATWSVDAHAP